MKNNVVNWDPKSLMHRFWILSVSLVITTGTAISPALPAMQQHFANTSPTLINMIATVQQIPAFIVLLFSSTLADRFGVKKIVGIGMLLMGVAGIFPAFVLNLWLILLSRLIFGIGIGMTNSLAITLVNIYYSGEEKAQMLGNRAAFEPIGICIINLSVGFLLNIGWQTSFLSYVFILIILLGFWKVIPEYKVRVKNNIQTNKKPRINIRVISASFFCGIMTIGMSIVNVLTPSILVENHLGSATEASLIITAYTIASMIMGFLFGTVFKVIKNFVLITGLFCMVIGTLLMNYADNIPVLTAGVIIIGLAYPMSGTFVFNEIGTVVASNSNALANSILLVGCNVGTAIAPVVISGLNQISPLKGTNPGIGLYGILMFFVIILIMILRKFRIIKVNNNVT